MIKILTGDCREVLKTLPDASVNCCVTSPPYFGLRDYGVDGQIGLEATPEAYVAELVAVFQQVWRVLRDDGTLWLNLGDSYAGGGNYRGVNSEATLSEKQRSSGGARGVSQALGAVGKDFGVEPKNLVGIPWRVAFALQADGWYLRQDIIWHKPNPMPESVTDRCTKAHEYMFLLSKSAKYYYDHEAINEKATFPKMLHKSATKTTEQEAAYLGNAPTNLGRCGTGADGLRNKRSVWTVATQPYKEAHFATFPPALIRPCILAGCPSQVCPKCGAPWERIVKKSGQTKPQAMIERGKSSYAQANGNALNYKGGHDVPERTSRTIGTLPTCSCNEMGCGGPDDPAYYPYDPISGTVLDPFGGSGTTGAVSEEEGRNSILCELNPAYVKLSEKRTEQQGLFCQTKIPLDIRPLF